MFPPAEHSRVGAQRHGRHKPVLPAGSWEGLLPGTVAQGRRGRLPGGGQPRLCAYGWLYRVGLVEHGETGARAWSGPDGLGTG